MTRTVTSGRQRLRFPGEGSRLPLAAGGLLAIGLTLLVYGTGLSVPFYSDDLLQVPWVKQTSLATMWHSVNPFDHYRPLQFSLWRLWYVASGDLQPAVLRAANLFFHALSGWLVGWLAGWLWRERLVPVVLATATFLLFPFAFDSVLWISSFAYPLATAVALGALVSYLHARETGSTGWHLLALLLTALSGLALESAVVTGATILLAELLLLKERKLAWPATHLLASALPFFLIWFFSTLPANDLLFTRLARNGTMLLQMTVFPLAPLLTPLLSSETGALMVVAAAGIGFTFFAGYFAYRRGWFPLFLFALVWIWLWNGVPAATQTYNWLRDPPRAFYPAAVGIALLWTSLLTDAGEGHSRRRRLVWNGFALLALLVPAAWFLSSRTALYQTAGDLLWQVIDLPATDGPTLFLNLPERLTPEQRIYPIGYEGVIPMPPPTDDVGLLRAAHSRPSLAAEERAAGQILPELAYTVAPVGPAASLDALDRTGRVLVATYGRENARLLGAYINQDNPTDSRLPRAIFDDALRLLSAACVPVGEGHLRLALTWQKVAEIGPADTVFVHLWQGGTVIAQADGAPVSGLYPFAAWPTGAIVYEERLLAWPAPASGARVGLGIYDGNSGERRPVSTPAGTPSADHAFYLPCE